MEHTPAEVVALVFVALAVIGVVARLMGRLAVRLGQPAVVGEIVAGIMLGPSLLGALPGDLDTLLFPPDVRPYLNVLAQLGLVLFMFLVGLEVDLGFIRGREKVAFGVSVSSILLPFALGVVLALQLHPPVLRALGMDRVENETVLDQHMHSPPVRPPGADGPYELPLL